ncbi:MAG: response regulator [Candidatus Cyclobacteriaceae bacterium M2_1C_046]
MKKILIIDDEEDILQIAETVLKNEYEVHSISFLHKPVTQVLEVNPDIILLDLGVPLTGGGETIRLLKKNEKTRNIPVYLFSANADIELIAQETGADGYMTKPFKIKDLKHFISDKIEQ